MCDRTWELMKAYLALRLTSLLIRLKDEGKFLKSCVLHIFYIRKEWPFDGLCTKRGEWWYQVVMTIRSINFNNSSIDSTCWSATRRDSCHCRR